MRNKKISHRTRGPILITYRKIGEVAAYREQYIKIKGTPPSLTGVCRRTLIDHRTIKRHAPQLIEKWKEKDFHW
jgi:hypothetical protein